MNAKCPACRDGTLVIKAKTDAAYTLNQLGQLRGKNIEMISVNPALPGFETISHASCLACKKQFPVEKTSTGIIRIKHPKVFIAEVVWASTCATTDTQLLDLFFHHGRRQCECCGEESGFVIGRGRAQSSLLPVARTNAAKMALTTDCTHVLFIDQDTTEFDHLAILRMASHDLPIVSAYVCRRAEPFDPVHRYMSTGENNTPVGYPQTPMISDDELDKLKEGRVQEVYAAGMAFTMIKREVLEAIGPPYFRFLPAEALKEDPSSGWFHGEDVSLCVLARQKGFKSYVDCGIHLGHEHGKAIGVKDWLQHHVERGGDGPEVSLAIETLKSGVV